MSGSPRSRKMYGALLLGVALSVGSALAQDAPPGEATSSGGHPKAASATLPPESSPAAAPLDPSLKATVDAVEAKYAAVGALTADFVQVTRSDVYGEDRQGGRVSIKRPACMRWDFADGEKQYVTDGKSLWIYTKSENQVLRYDGVASSGPMDQILSSLAAIDESFAVKAGSGEPGQVVLELVPHVPETFKSIRLAFSEALVLESLVITDFFDAKTEIGFSNVDLAADVPDSTFAFEIPAGAELIVAGSY